MTRLFALISALGALAASAAHADDLFAHFTAECPRLNFPIVRLTDEGRVVPREMLHILSQDEYAIRYSCQPVQCLYYIEPGFRNRTYGVYLRNAQTTAATQLGLARRQNDPNVLRSGLPTQEAAIEQARKFLNQGLCAEVRAMPNPAEL